MIERDWHGCYSEGWTGLICPDAFAHPAKFARGLIRRIYEHAFEQGWFTAGDVVVDPFGGVALGALHAQQRGLNWVGVELEQKFVDLGSQNLALWNDRYGPHLPKWGTAQIFQGDSRELAAVLRQAQDRLLGRAAGSVSSPPYAELPVNDAQRHSRHATGNADNALDGPTEYGQTNGNLGNLRASDTDHAAAVAGAVSSPPYTASLASDDPDKRGGLFRDPKRRGDKTLTAEYGESAGQLGTMPEGEFAGVVSSPPYANSMSSGQSGIDWTKTFDSHRRNRAEEPFFDSMPGGGAEMRYSDGPANLGNLPEGEHGAALAQGAVSSPPYEGSAVALPNGAAQCQLENLRRAVAEGRVTGRESLRVAQAGFNENTNLNSSGGNYGQTDGQLGQERGNTFWAAARTIMEQLWLVLEPGAHTIFVVKSFVRKGQRVDFPNQWRELGEACGFETVEWIRAWLVEDRGAQFTLEGGLDERTIERKSFFRRLAERKGSPRIDYEVVLVQRKPAREVL